MRRNLTTVTVIIVMMVIGFLVNGCATQKDVAYLRGKIDAISPIMITLRSDVDGLKKNITDINIKKADKSTTASLKKAIIRVKKTVDSNTAATKNLCTKINRNTGRLAKIEDVVDYAHPNTKTDSVNTFKPGDSYLSEAAKTYLDKIVERVNKKEVAIKQIIGYADLSPASKGTTNKDIARHRAEAVAQYLKEKGIDLSNIVIHGDGATNRYGNKKKNRRATIILEKLPVAPVTAAKP